MVSSYWQVASVIVFAIYGVSVAVSDRLCSQDEQVCFLRSGVDDIRRNRLLSAPPSRVEHRDLVQSAFRDKTGESRFDRVTPEERSERESRRFETRNVRDFRNFENQNFDKRVEERSGEVIHNRRNRDFATFKREKEFGHLSRDYVRNDRVRARRESHSLDSRRQNQQEDSNTDVQYRLNSAPRHERRSELFSNRRSVEDRTNTRRDIHRERSIRRSSSIDSDSFRTRLAFNDRVRLDREGLLATSDDILNVDQSRFEKVDRHRDLYGSFNTRREMDRHYDARRQGYMSESEDENLGRRNLDRERTVRTMVNERDFINTPERIEETSERRNRESFERRARRDGRRELLDSRRERLENRREKTGHSIVNERDSIKNSDTIEDYSERHNREPFEKRESLDNRRENLDRERTVRSMINERDSINNSDMIEDSSERQNREYFEKRERLYSRHERLDSRRERLDSRRERLNSRRELLEKRRERTGRSVANEQDSMKNSKMIEDSSERRYRESLERRDSLDSRRDRLNSRRELLENRRERLDNRLERTVLNIRTVQDLRNNADTIAERRLRESFERRERLDNRRDRLDSRRERLENRREHLNNRLERIVRNIINEQDSRNNADTIEERRLRESFEKRERLDSRRKNLDNRRERLDSGPESTGRSMANERNSINNSDRIEETSERRNREFFERRDSLDSRRDRLDSESLESRRERLDNRLERIVRNIRNVQDSKNNADTIEERRLRESFERRERLDSRRKNLDNRRERLDSGPESTGRSMANERNSINNSDRIDSERRNREFFERRDSLDSRRDRLDSERLENRRERLDNRLERTVRNIRNVQDSRNNADTIEEHRIRESFERRERLDSRRERPDNRLDGFDNRRELLDNRREMEHESVRNMRYRQQDRLRGRVEGIRNDETSSQQINRHHVTGETRDKIRSMRASSLTRRDENQNILRANNEDRLETRFDRYEPERRIKPSENQRDRSSFVRAASVSNVRNSRDYVPQSIQNIFSNAPLKYKISPIQMLQTILIAVLVLKVITQHESLNKKFRFAFLDGMKISRPVKAY